MIDNPWFYAAAVPAVLMIGISKGGLAGGLGFMAVPLMALVIPPLQAAGILLPILILMDVIGVWAYRRTWHRASLVILIPGAVTGIAVGTLTAQFIEEHHVRLIVGAIAVIFTLDHWIGRRAARDPKPPRTAPGLFWGGVGGFTSFVAHAGSPPFQVFMLPQKLDKTVYVGTSIMFFWIVNLVKLPPYWYLGQLAPGNLATAGILLPLAPLGMYLGIRLHHAIPQEPFYRVVYVLVFVVGVKLIWDGTTALLGA